MSAKASTAADEPTHGVTIAAKSSYGELSGTRHIVIDGEPLCGHPQVEKHIESGRYGTETTRHPLNSYDTCKTCGTIYAKEHGSEHDAFAELAEYDEGDWVKIRTGNGDIMTGRVRSTADITEMPSRRLWVVVSDEPQERWVYGVENEVKVKVREGEQPVIMNGSVMDDDYSETPIAGISGIDAPKNNPDARTEATISEIREIGDGAINKIGAYSQGRTEFTVYSADYLPRQEAWNLLDKLYKAGYEIRFVTPPCERGGDNYAIGVTAGELARNHDEIVTDGGQTLISGAALQNAMLTESREGRLADEPIGPEPAETPDELRQHFEAMEISAGDRIKLHDGVEATIDGVVPALANNEVTESEIIVHYSGIDDGEFRATLPAWMAADDLRRGDWKLVSDYAPRRPGGRDE